MPNLIIEVDDDRRRATARSYYAASQALPDSPLQPILVGRWHDHFERIHARWRFTDRTVFVDLIGDVSHHLKVDSGPEGLAISEQPKS